jgi:hypothetical protein
MAIATSIEDQKRMPEEETCCVASKKSGPTTSCVIISYRSQEVLEAQQRELATPMFHVDMSAEEIKLYMERRHEERLAILNENS